MRTPQAPARSSFLRLSPLRALARSCRRWLSPRRAAPIRTRAPSLEALEDRRVPAVFTPDYLMYTPLSGGPLSSSGPVGYTPTLVTQAYGINLISLAGGVKGDGNGQTIAIVDAGDDPTILADLTAFDVAFGLPAPPSFMRVNQTGGALLPQPVTGWQLEISLDVEWSHAIAPAANILLVESTTDNDADMNVATTYAAGQAAVVSMSFGESESGLTKSQELAYDTAAGFTNHTGVTFVASSGDSGAPPIWPASSPYVVATGGTSLTLAQAGGYGSESGWNGSGGGVSIHEAQPSYQQGLTIHNGSTLVSSNGFRVTPDVAYDSDPATGFAVRDSYNYGALAPWVKVGGTSAAAPQWAALFAIADEGRALNNLKPLDGPGQALPALYQLAAGDYHDVTTGTSTGSPQYTAAPGFDLVTGLGSPLANLAVSGLVAASPGARVVASAPDYDGQGGLNGVTLTFNEAIRSGGFTSAAVDSFTGPGGAIAPTGVTPLSSTQFEVTFASQTVPGPYTLVVGPNIPDAFGNPMDQNGDAIPGEVPGDQYTTTLGLPMPVALPFQENFDDGVAHGFVSQSGSWSFSGGRYDAAPVSVGGDQASLLQVSGALPSNLEFDVLMNATAASGSYFSNGFILFDYQGPTNFKYAGAYVGNQQWVVGHRDANGWEIDATFGDAGIAPGTDFNLQLLLQGTHAELLANGTSKVGFTFASAFTGSVGLGAWNSLTQFDNLAVQQSPVATLPIQENFDDGVAHYFSPQSGNWGVGAGRYDVAPSAVAADALSTLLIGGSLPSNLEFDVLMNAAAPAGNYYSNGFLVFDYQSPTNFKFAGAYVGNQQWVVGHRDANGWEVDATFADSGIAPGTDYNLQLLLQGGNASLFVNGTGKVSTSYASAFSGSVGLATENSVAQFDNLTVQQQSSGTLPIQENFADGVAHYFSPQSGTWVVSAGRYGDTPSSAGADAVSALLINGALPSSLEFDVLMNAAAPAGSYYSNGFIIFDYQSPTSFKYAGAFVGLQQWVIGHRDANGWHNDAAAGDPTIAPGTDFNLQLLLQGSNVNLLVNGAGKVSTSYASGFTGSVGLGTEDSLTQFTNLTVQQYSPPGGGNLPIQENFGDGVAHYFSPQSGSWTVSAGRYDDTPSSAGADTVSTLLINGALPSSLEFDVLMNAAAPAGNYYSNGFIVFDYQGPTNFKYAGAFVGNQQWVIGHRDANGWHNDAAVSDPSITPGTDFTMQMLLQGSDVSLLVNGTSKVGTSYASGFSGSVGLGTANSLTQFTNLTVQQYNPPGGGNLPIQENFDDGVAHYFSPQSGSWGASAGRYDGAPSAAGADAVSTLLINGGAPSKLEFDVLMNAAAASGNLYSNGFIVFDYQSPTNFKFAGAYVGLQEWVVGHRDANGWEVDATFADSGIAPGTDYNLQLLLQGNSASLLVNGVSKVSHTYAAAFSGAVGLGTENSLTQFDNLNVKSS